MNEEYYNGNGEAEELRDAAENAAEAVNEEPGRAEENRYAEPENRGFRPRPEYRQPDYRSAYGQTYDPYARSERPSVSYYEDHARYAEDGPQRNPDPGVHTYAGGYYGGGAYAPETRGNTEKKKTKKEKKSGSSVKKAVAWMAVLCILLSAAFGAGGVYVGSRLFGNKDTESEYRGTVNYTKGEATVPTADGSISAAAAIAADSVVEITTEAVSTNAFFGQYIQSGAGSGVIISGDGNIITCAHVVEGATTVTVRLSNGDSFEAKVLGSDSRTDIAVIKIDATGLTAASIGDSDAVVVGQTAIAIGNPLGTLGGTVTSGTISALNREITIDGQNYTLLQTDASINPGNSGGGLFDVNGNLIGIVNAKSGSNGSTTTIEGLGFAIPINQAIDVASQLAEQGYVGGRVNLGIYVCEVGPSTSMTELYQAGYGELIDYITDYGIYFLKYQSGQNGDFKFGDRIIAVDGMSVSSRADVQSILEDYSIGDSVTVTVSRMNSDMRRAQVVEVTVNLVEYIPETTAENP